MLPSTTEIAENITASPEPLEKSERESFDDIYNRSVMEEMRVRAQGWNGERRLPAQVQWTLSTCRAVFERMVGSERQIDKLKRQVSDLANVVAGLADLAKKGK